MRRAISYDQLIFVVLIGLGAFCLIIGILTLLGPTIGAQVPDQFGPATENYYEFERISTSPDASKIAFTYDYYIADTKESLAAFYVVNGDGTNLQLVVIDMYIREMAWSSDSSQLACVGIQGDNWNILVVDTENEYMRELISGPDPKYELTWLPDGETLAYEDGNERLYLSGININSGKSQRLTTIQSERVLSPDNNRVALVDTVNDQVDIFVIDIDGTDRQQLTDTSAIEAFVQWSPDGDKLAYLSETETDNPELWLHEIYILPLSTRRAQLVTSDYRGHLYEPSAFTQLNSDPTVPNPRRYAWSSDGNHFAFETEDKLFTADANGVNPVELKSPDFRPVMVSWLDDNSTVVASSLENDHLAISIDGGDIRPLSNDEIARYFPVAGLDVQKVCTKNSPPTGEWAMYHPCLRMELHIVDNLTKRVVFSITPEQLIQPEGALPPK